MAADPPVSSAAITDVNETHQLVDEPSQDGRMARSARTRRAIVDACLVLINQGDLRPTAPRVAQEASVSVRSVFQHFADLDGLFSAVGDRVLESLGGLVLQVDASLPLSRRLPLVIAQRGALLEAITPVRRATAVNAWSSPLVSRRLTEGQQFLRHEVAGAFGPELEIAGTGAKARLDSLDLLLSWAVWDQLRAGMGMSIEAAVEHLERMCLLVLKPLVLASNEPSES